MFDNSSEILDDLKDDIKVVRSRGKALWMKRKTHNVMCDVYIKGHA